MDFGGNGSRHALAASGLTHNCEQLYALKTERIPAEGMTPQALYKRVYDFCEKICNLYGTVSAVYADSAEQTLIAGLRLALKPLGVVVKNSLKRQINDRFFMISEDCGSLIDAFKGAVWNDKIIGKEERLDDGTSDIDTLDAFEYSFEKFIPQLIRSEKT